MIVEAVCNSFAPHNDLADSGGAGVRHGGWRIEIYKYIGQCQLKVVCIDGLKVLVLFNTF
jgi:hypothetical protein